MENKIFLNSQILNSAGSGIILGLFITDIFGKNGDLIGYAVALTFYIVAFYLRKKSKTVK